MRPGTLIAPFARGMLVAAALAFVPVAAAHAHLASGDPQDHSVVVAPLTQVRLEFTEDVETGFSRFELYALSPEPVPAATDTAGSAPWAALDEEAKAQFERVLASPPREQDYPLKLVAQGTTAQVELKLESELHAGNYMLFFKVVSVDTHTSSGYVLFSYQPAECRAAEVALPTGKVITADREVN